MKNEKHKGVREMRQRPTQEGRGVHATIQIRCDDNGLWQINGDPCRDDLTAMRIVAECMESLADARDRKLRIAARRAA